VHSEIVPRTTSNLLAQTAAGRTDNVVVVGTHLDALPAVSPTTMADLASPAINAAGTGSAALLEVASRLAGTAVGNAVRFVWWGAGELTGPVDYVTAHAYAGNGVYARFFHAMLDRGIALAPGAYEVMFPGLAHTDEVLASVVSAAGDAAHQVAKELLTA